MLNRFKCVKPRTVDEALSHLGGLGKEAKVLAGGTDLLVQIKKRRASPRYLIDLMSISELDQIEDRGGEIRIGPTVTLAALEKSVLIQNRFPSLWNAVRVVATPQLRNMGTMGGNLCVETRCKFMDFSHPWGREISGRCFKREGNVCHVVKGGDRCHAIMAGDLAVALIALGAKVVIRGQSERTIPLEDLYTGEGKYVLKMSVNELLTQIQILALPPHAGASFLKHRWRESLDFPIVSAAAWVVKDPKHGTCQEVRLILGALASAPLQIKKTGDLLRNKMLSDQTIKEAVEEGIKGIPIVSCSGLPVSYIRRMARTFALKAIQEAYEATH
jgi:4-hydroxybenzoyl-CoA reductase subunit beta